MSTSTDEEGNFELATPQTPELASEAASNGGWDNFFLAGVSKVKINGITESHLYHVVFTSFFTGSSWDTPFDVPDPTLGQGCDTLTECDVVVPGPRVGPQNQILIPPDAQVPTLTFDQLVQSIATDCSRHFIANQGAQTVVGEIHTAGDISYAQLTYGPTADTYVNALDCKADSDCGNQNNWAIEPSQVHVGTNAGATVLRKVTTDNWGHRIRSGFNYTEYYWGGGCQPYNLYEIVPTNWTQGMTDGSDNSSFDHQCTSTYSQYVSKFGSGTAYYRSANQYVTFFFAATLSTLAGGKTTNAHSGLSPNVDVQWHFGSNDHDHYLCGNDAHIDSSHRIFAGA